MPSLFRRIWSGIPFKKSRFHDELGNLVGWRESLHAPKALLQALRQKATGWRPPLPWLGYSAIARIESLLRPAWRVLEFGAGRSTPWFARRCREVVSVEGDPAWEAQVRERLKQEGLTNVRLLLRGNEEYAVLEEVADGSIDLALVDGWMRERCAATALAKVRRGGWIYLDNSDRTTRDRSGDVQAAAELLRNAARRPEGECHVFIDFAPAQFLVNQGLLVRVG